MTEQEKMLSGAFYDASDEDLHDLRVRAHDLCRQYNFLSETDAKRQEILKELLPNAEPNVYLQGPIQFDYGCFTTIGEQTYVNFSFTCLDCAAVSIGKHVLIGPNVSLYTALHPMDPNERLPFRNEDGTMSALEYAHPIVIEDDVWIGGSVTVCAGVTIGRGSVIGAGSVVTRDIPANVLAAGNPCKVIRELE